jgi:hypothetical protein
MTTLSKRGLLQALTGLAAVSISGLAHARTPDIAAIDAVGAAGIGRAWLALHPSDAPALRAALFPRDRPEESLPRLARRVSADFERGDIFVHKGWFLSDTEARICALIALS